MEAVYSLGDCKQGEYQCPESYFWFNSANCKATEEMERQFAIIKSAENETDFNNALEYVQECLQLQAAVNQSLGKALDSLLGSSMTMAANMLLSRRDNYLKNCSKDVTEDDISKLRNAPLKGVLLLLMKCFQWICSLRFRKTLFSGPM